MGVEVPSATEWSDAHILLVTKIQELKEMVGSLTPQDRPPPVDFSPVLEQIASLAAIVQAQGVKVDSVLALLTALQQNTENVREVLMAFRDTVEATVVPASPGGGSFPEIGSPFNTTSGTAMTLKHSDEFVGVFDADLGKNYIDKSKWITTFWQGTTERTLGGNGEAQYYMDPDYPGQNPNYKPRNQRPNPFEFTADPNGILNIKAFPVPSADWANWWMGIQRPFCSGILNSMPDIHSGQPFFPTNRSTAAPRPGWLFQYGYVEIRAKLPKKFGPWPAFWFLHDDTLDGFNFASAESDYFGRVNEVVSKHGWPPEYDRIESFGHRPTQIHDGYVTVSGLDAGFGFGDWRNNPGGFDISADFHTYGVEINASNIIENIDGVVSNTFATPPSWKVANRRWYTMLNLAVGGNWYAGEINSGQFGTDSIKDASGAVPAPGQCKAWTVDVDSMPWEYQLDYIRFYEP